MDFEKLILLVKQHEAIYNPNHRDHRDRAYIASLWKSISAELEVTESLVKDKWHNLRSNFMREKRSLGNKTAPSGEPLPSRWPHYDMLSFLHPFCDRRDNKKRKLANRKKNQALNHCDAQEPKVEAELIDHDIIECRSSDAIEEPEEIYEYVESPVGNLVRLISPVKNNCDQTCGERVNEMDHEYIKGYKKARITTILENDSDTMFMHSILPLIKQLSPVDNLDFKIKVQQYLRSKLFPISENVNEDPLT